MKLINIILMFFVLGFVAACSVEVDSSSSSTRTETKWEVKCYDFTGNIVIEGLYDNFTLYSDGDTRFGDERFWGYHCEAREVKINPRARGEVIYNG